MFHVCCLSWGTLNQDGKSASFTAPNGKSQQELLLQALKSAHINPADISYLETHGTGTPLGDPIEFSAIKSVFLTKYVVKKHKNYMG